MYNKCIEDARDSRFSSKYGGMLYLRVNELLFKLSRRRLHFQIQEALKRSFALENRRSKLQPPLQSLSSSNYCIRYLFKIHLFKIERSRLDPCSSNGWPIFTCLVQSILLQNKNSYNTNLRKEFIKFLRIILKGQCNCREF